MTKTVCPMITKIVSSMINHILNDNMPTNRNSIDYRGPELKIK